MPRGNLYNKLSPEEKKRYTNWMIGQYEWRAGALLGDDYYVRKWQVAAERVPEIRAVPGSEAVTPPEASEAPERELVWFVPGQIKYESKTGKFYDADGLFEITRSDALSIRNQYDLSLAGGGTQPQIGGGWRPGELEFQREQFEWQKRQAEQAVAKSYEEWRRRLIGELTGPGDWITRWMVEQTPEKYPWTPQVPMSDIQRSIAQTEAAIASRISEIRVSPQQLPEILPELENLVAMEEQLAGWKQAEAGFVETKKPTIEDIAAGVKGTPPAPEWLSKFAPGQVAGRPITKEQIPTPSGQQLTRLAPSKASALGGFADWAGGRPWQDILAHAELMQPRTPGGGARWRPISQGVS